MNQLPRQILRQLIADYGSALLDDPARLDAFLADLCGEYPRERFLLVHALRVRVSVANWPVMYWLGSYAGQLQIRYCFSPEAAQWATESWSSALNIAPPDPDTFYVSGDTRHDSKPELAELPRSILSRLLADYGPALVNEPARVDALLADLCTEYPRERFLLVHALRERIPADLLARPRGGGALGQRLTRRLQSEYGFSAEAARWAVESWAMALHGEALSIPLPRITISGSAKTDRDALVALYHATNGASWRNNENWLSDALLDTWYGVSTDCSGRVTSLKLSVYGSNGLSGAIPSELGNLSKLTSLDLRSGQLSGPIPSELANLPNLTSLDLSFNQLSGPIPAELGNLSNLTYLDLSFNQLSGPIPAELDNLSNLTYLNLSFNQLSGPIPAELDNLSNLTYLNLSVNKLEGSIPTELARLSKLAGLDLSVNGLSGPVPAELANLSNLTHLNLSDNKLEGSIPPELGNLSNLRELALSFNQLSGPIPAELRDHPNLEKLTLDEKNQERRGIP